MARGPVATYVVTPPPTLPSPAMPIRSGSRTQNCSMPSPIHGLIPWPANVIETNCCVALRQTSRSKAACMVQPRILRKLSTADHSVGGGLPLHVPAGSQSTASLGSRSPGSRSAWPIHFQCTPSTISCHPSSQHRSRNSRTHARLASMFSFASRSARHTQPDIVARYPYHACFIFRSAPAPHVRLPALEQATLVTQPLKSRKRVSKANNLVVSVRRLAHHAFAERLSLMLSSCVGAHA